VACAAYGLWLNCGTWSTKYLSYGAIQFVRVCGAKLSSTACVAGELILNYGAMSFQVNLDNAKAELRSPPP
jgi:hypothetical protein